MSLAEAACYMVILLKADHETGIWWGSASFIASIFGGQADERTARRALDKLEKSGYIKRFQTRGKRGNYPILIGNYFCRISSGTSAVIERVLNAEATTDYEHPVYEVCREAGSEDGSEAGSDVPPIQEEEVINIYNTTTALAFDSPKLKITQEQDRALSKAFPHVLDRQAEYRKMESWVMANRPNLKNYARQAHSWFSNIKPPASQREAGLDIPLADRPF